MKASRLASHLGFMFAVIIPLVAGSGLSVQYLVSGQLSDASDKVLTVAQVSNFGDLLFSTN